MASRDLILAIDQGTTSTRAIVFDRRLRTVAASSRPLTTAHPQPGWVEQDPEAILASVVETVAEVLQTVGGAGRIAAVGLDNQGETVVAWDAENGRALAPAVVWQCRRSLPIVERLRAEGREERIRRLTGLPLDPYFSAGKLAWLLENIPAVQEAAHRRTLRLGTVDAWLTARLGDSGPLTDPSTASRTQLLGLRSLRWEPELLDRFGVPPESLPRIVPSVGPAGDLGHPAWGGTLPLWALACDQQAALAGHGAFRSGDLKATYGTGVFLLANAGTTPPETSVLEVSVAWTLPGGRRDYVLQGGVLTAGALVDWLASQLGLFADPRETEELARSVRDDAGVRFLPALAGLGAPWYRPASRAVVAGLSAAASRAHLIRAALDGIAQRVCDIAEAMTGLLAVRPGILRVDGGLTANGYLMQRQADLLGVPVAIARAEESTALGIAALAGLGAGLLDEEQISAANPAVRTLVPALPEEERRRQREEWRAFVERASDL